MQKTSRAIVTLLILAVLSFYNIIMLVQVHAPTVQPMGAYTFGAPTAVENVPGVDDQPSAVQSANGTIWIAWRSARACGCSGQYNIFVKTFNGTRWTPSVNVTSTGTNSHPSLSQLLNGTIILVWTSNLSGYDNLYYKTNTNRVWSGTVQLSLGQFYDDWSHTAVSQDSTLWLVWERDTPTGLSRPTFYHQIYFRTLVGNSWSSESPLTNNLSVDSVTPTVTVAKRGQLWFAWSSNTTNSFNIVYRTLNGTQWSSDNVLTTGPANDSWPNIVQDRNGTIWLFWSRPITLGLGLFQYKLFGKFSGDLGKTWTGNIQITFGGDINSPIQDVHPSAIQAIDNRLWVFYSSNQLTGLDYDLYYVRTGQIFPVHDVAVTRISVSPVWTYPWGDAPQSVITVNVTVTNLGDYDESTLALTLRATNSTMITVGTVLMNTIIAGFSDSVVFSWDTLATRANYGRYSLTASIPRIVGETVGSAVDNRLSIPKAASVLIPGALAKTSCITIIDAGMMGRAFGSTPSSIYWNPDADLANHGVITIIDFGILAARFGKCL